jgi:N-methylhydantoinase A
MAFAIRSVTIEQGQDPREAAILAFGGAGPLFGTLLAQELDVKTIVVPKHAGNFSAWGLLGQDLTRSRALTSIRQLDDAGVEAANGSFADMFAGLSQDGAEEREPALDLRYVGQEYTLTVLPRAEGGKIVAPADEIAADFKRDYLRTFGHQLEVPVEIVNVRATTRTALPRKANEKAVSGAPANTERRTVSAHSFTEGERLEFGVIDRAALEPGERVEGPVIVLEQTTTTYVDAGFTLDVHPSGTLIIEQKGL